MKFKLIESKEDIKKFVDKFGEDTYEEFKKATQRLKNAGMSTDILVYVKDEEMTKEKLDKILFNLKNRIQTKDENNTELAGEYKYLGEKNGYKVYQPLDALASMNLGVGTGWCTTGRYGHAGEKNCKPSFEEARKHFDDYTSKGIELYYFLDARTMEGKYAIAKYPRILEVNEFIDKNTYIEETNFELYNQEDNIDYSAIDKIPIKLIKGLEIKKEDEENGLFIRDNILIKANKDVIKVSIPSSVTSIGEAAFDKCSSLKNIVIPNNITSIGSYAFRNCSSLTSVTFGENSQLTSIGEMAFYNCSSLTSVTIPSSVISIGKWVFSSCNSLTSIVIPNSVTSIDNYAFAGCSSLTSVVIPESVTGIGSYAFYDCSSLTNITIPISITSIDNGAFRYCNLTKIYYHGTEAEWNKIKIGNYNEELLNATIHYNSKFQEQKEIKEDLDKTIQRISKKYKPEREIKLGASYLLPSGEFIYTKDYGHKEIDDYLVEIGEYKEEEIETEEGNLVLSKENCVRLNAGIGFCFIGLPDKNLSLEQYESLEKWLELLEEKGYGRIDIFEQLKQNPQAKRYNLKEETPEEIIKKIKRYYSSGKLYESKIEEKIEITNYKTSFGDKEKEFKGYGNFAYIDRDGNYITGRLDEKLEDIIERVKEEFGTTRDWRETGWLFRDGTQLDLSGKNFGGRSGKRTVDHREIFDDTDDMIEFMSQGNIRISPETPGINLQVEPTEEQYEKIKAYIESIGYRDNYFAVDFDNKNGDTVDHREYDDVDAVKIIRDIENYFKNGRQAYRSELQQFREDIDENNIAKRLNSYIKDDNLIIVDAELDGDTIHCRVLDYSYDDAGEEDIVDYYKSDFDIKDWEYIINGKYIQEDVEENKTIDDDNIKEYINKYILSLSNNEIINNAKLKERTTFKEGPLFIIPNGNLIDSSEYAIAEGYGEDDAMHSIVALYICDEIFDNLGFDRDYMFYAMDDFLEDLTNKYGWIRVNSGTGSVDGRCYIVIPENKRPSEEQFNTLEEWFDFLQNTVGQFDIRVMVKNKDIAYDFDEYTSKDIINKIKRYYSSGNLYEDLSEEEMSNEYDSEGNQLTKAQAEFFRNSKVRDSKGRLLVCYHGTNNEFDEFKKEKALQNFSVFGNGFYFLDNEKGTKEYGNKTKKCYLNMTNPLSWEKEKFSDYIDKYHNEYFDNHKLIDIASEIEKEGFDGLIWKSNTYIVFEPNQIKSVTNKNPSSSNNINENKLEESKYIDLNVDYEEIDDYIKKNYGQTKDLNSLKTDSQLINKEGYFVDLGKDETHIKILRDLVDKGLIKSKDSTLDEMNLINTDLFTDLGYIRLNSNIYDYTYVQLPKKQITSAQYNTLTKWLDDLASRSDIVEGEIHISLDVSIVDGPAKWYSYVESVDYIIDRIKRYYASGKLYENRRIKKIK